VLNVGQGIYHILIGIYCETQLTTDAQKKFQAKYFWC